jgi:aspartyl-tRNA(Asn)/glutamyl-tRNA(Gln) amidotransferase subunit A
LSRFDGIRFGARVDCETWKDTIEETRTTGFGPEVKRRILLGTFTLSAGYKRAYYAKAFLARESITNEFNHIFKEADFILTPTTTTLPFQFGAKIDPMQMYMSDICTIPAALAGLPAVSIPFGFSDNGLPLGMQIIGPSCSERNLHQIAKIIESYSK